MNHNRLSRIIPAPQVKAAVPVRFGSLSGEPPMAESAQAVAPVSYTHLTLPTTPYV